MPPAAPIATCPNCAAAITPGSRQCRVCKLEVSKMAAFAAAKKAAQQRGFRSTAVQTGETPAWRDPGTIIKYVLLLAFLGGIGWLGYHFFGPKPPRYLQFPATAQDAVQAFITGVSGGDATYNNAYALLADAAHASKNNEDHGAYMQVFHSLNQYLAGEFGGGWIGQTNLAPDPANPDIIIAKVALETLHIRTAQQTPLEKMQQYGPHYGILGIDELDVSDAAELQKFAAIRDIVGGVAGKGSQSDLDAILGAYASNRHQPPFIKKMDLLQTLRNPRAANWKAVVQTYPLRADPVIRARLTTMLADERYDQAPRDKARDVLTDKVDESDLTAVGL